jgi:hypothetical protein
MNFNISKTHLICIFYIQHQRASVYGHKENALKHDNSGDARKK